MKQSSSLVNKKKERNVTLFQLKEVKVFFFFKESDLIVS